MDMDKFITTYEHKWTQIFFKCYYFEEEIEGKDKVKMIDKH
jgi:hypothetical protein